MAKELEIRRTTREERRSEIKAALAASEARRQGEKSAYHKQVNDEMRRRFSPSDEIAILRHAVVILADALIQANVLKQSDIEELLSWNALATKIKDKAKLDAKKGE